MEGRQERWVLTGNPMKPAMEPTITTEPPLKRKESRLPSA